MTWIERNPRRHRQFNTYHCRSSDGKMLPFYCDPAYASADMKKHVHLFLPIKPSLSFLLLVIFFCVLWLAGGASRDDVLGQAVVRGGAWVGLIVAFLFARRPSFADNRPVLFLLIAVIALPLAQLVPLPPAMWQALPGRDLVVQIPMLGEQAQTWRPVSLVPGMTFNAASSLIVPVATLAFVTALKETERPWLPGIMLLLVVGSMLIGLIQFSGIRFANPLVNYAPGQVTGTFANRNHFALFVALGCLIAPVWAFLYGERPIWRGSVAVGLLLLFALIILASGSRAGMAAGALALVTGPFLVRKEIQSMLRAMPRWIFPAMVVALIGLISTIVIISIAADRAESIHRAMTTDISEDMRSRGMPTVLAMIMTYFPAGTGFGSFDPIFRIHEPFDLLKASYFNHAHNDFLQIALEAGLAGILLMLAAMLWWAYASVRVWTCPGSAQITLARLGSAMLFLIFVASLVDYPGRTPLIMAVITVAATWLGWGANASRQRVSLPEHAR